MPPKKKKSIQSRDTKSGKRGVPEEKTKKEKKPMSRGKVIVIVVLALMLVTIGEIVFVAKKSVRESKKPEFIKAWDKGFMKGATSIENYGDHMYIVDNSRGDVYKCDKMSGKLLKVFEMGDEGALSAVEAKNGHVYILTKQNTVIHYTPDNNKAEKIPLKGRRNVRWMDVDSDNNFYLVEHGDMKVYKYSDEFEPVLSFGGKGEGGDKFNMIVKLDAGADKNIYCLDNVGVNKYKIRIFGRDGRFKKSWQIKRINKMDGLTDMAITSKGYVYINGVKDSRVFVFNNNGKFMSSFDTDKDRRFVIKFPPCITGGENKRFFVLTHQMAIFRTIDY